MAGHKNLIVEIFVGVTVAVIAALVVWRLGINEPRSSGITESGVAGGPEADPEPEHPLEGNWQQLLWVGEEWSSGGVYRVTSDDGALNMSIVENWTTGQGAVRSTGLRGVTYQDGVWRFASILENGYVVTFELRRIDDNTYEGYSSVGTANRWIRMR